MTRSSAKFLFDQDFAATREAKPSVPQAAHEAALTEADATGYRRGFAAGRAEALASAEERAAAAIERIARLIEELKQSLAAVEAKLETEAIEVAVAIARKLAATLIEREPAAENAALVTDCVRHLVAAPHVAVRVSEVEAASVAARIEEIARARGLANELVVRAEPGIAPGDCRIEWTDGGMNRERTATEAAIAETVSRYVMGRLAGAPEDSRRSDR
jgi:flagellar assembly protein FliH